VKLKVDRAGFAEAIGWVTRSAGARPSLPALAGVLLVAADDRLTFGSTDLEVTAETAVPATIETPGRVLLSARMLAQLVARFPDAPVQLEDEGDRLRISCGRAKFRVRRLNVEDFPTLPSIAEGAPRATVKTDAFSRLAAQVARAAAGPDDGRPVLAGVRLEAIDGRLVAAATDTFRLATRSVAFDGTLTNDAIVPARALTEAARSATEQGEAVTVVLEAGQVSFLFGERRLTSRLIEGSYPDYRSLFPDAHEVDVTIDRAALTEALQRVSVIASAQTNTPVVLAISEGGVDVTASNQEAGDAMESVEAAVNGAPSEGMEIAFNPVYLIAGLEAAGTERVRLELRDGLRAAVIRPVGAEDEIDDLVYLLMPMRVS
jgi:DNA polymerase-3 subunit beta